MGEASFEMRATPPRIDKAPENNASEEEENAATSTDAERPTVVDPPDAKQSSQEQPPPEETHPEKTDDGSYQPTPGARQSPNFGTSSEKTKTMKT